MFDVSLKTDESFVINSEKKEVILNKKYRISTEIIAKSGKPYSAYFGVIFLDDHDNEIDRKIRWLNHFSNEKRELDIVITARTQKILLIYRINAETPNKSNCIFSLLSIHAIKLHETQELENFDDVNDYSVPRPKELSPEEEQILEKNLVWLFGSPRSGTSWVALQLLSHNTHSINEPHIDDHLGAVLHGITSDTVRWIDRRRWDPNYFFSDAHKDTWQYYLRKLILNRIYAQVNDISKKIIIKSPGSFGSADIISECFPNSKMILLFRDGRDVIDSLIDARTKNGFMTKSGAEIISTNNKLDFIKSRSKIWITLMNNLMKSHDTHSDTLTFITKYEDLRRDTFPEIKKIYEFIDVQIGDDELREIIDKYDFKRIPKQNTGSGKFHRSASPGKWRENFTEDEKVVMETIMGETLRKLGYM